MTRYIETQVMSEDQLLSAVLELAKLRGWLAFHVRNSKRGVIQGDVGFPDLVLCRGQRLLFVELKAGTLQPSEQQWRWLVPLAGIVWRPSDWTSGAIDAVLR